MLKVLAPFFQKLRSARRPRRRRGMVLAVVLWLMVVLVVGALGLAYDTQVSVRSLRNTDNQARAYYAALSGLERVAAELDNPNGVYYTAANQTWRHLDSNDELLLPEADSYAYRVIAQDNCSRLDLNEVDDQMLAKVPELTSDQQQAILAYKSGGTSTTPGSTPSNGPASTAQGQ